MFYVSSSFLTCCLSRERSAPSTGGMILRFLPRDWPKFTTGNSKIYTLIKTAYTRHFTIIFSWMHTVNTKKNRSGQWEQVKPKALSIPVTTSLCVMSSGWGELTVSVHMSQFICLCVQERMDVCISGTFVCTDIVCTGTLVSFFFLSFLVCV